MACSELRERLRAGESLRVEDLLAVYPALAGRDEAVFELIHSEISTRHDMGDRPTLEEWQNRFPSLLRRTGDLDALRNLFGSELPTLSDSPAFEQGSELRSARCPDGRLPRVRNYQLLQEIGRGGMGVVYKARQANLSRVVALKMILAGEHAGLRERARLRNEAEAAAQLLHPNVVQIFDIGEHEGLPFLAMEYVAGGNLRRMMRGTPQAFRWSARLAETLARAIHVAHQRGIVHRDLNPSNILMTPEGVPKISDFGLAKFLLEDAGVSLNGVILGTPSYMAPEQISGHRQGVGPGTDVYALGALLYEMLTGTAPFRGFTPMETLCQVVEAEVVPPSRLRHGVPEDLETICLKCLEKEPTRRYSSAADLADDLRRFQENQPIQARRTPWPHQLLHWARRQRLAASLLGLSLMLLIALLSLAGGYLITISRVNSELKHQLAKTEMFRSLGYISKEQLEAVVNTTDKRLRDDGRLSQVKQCIDSGQVELAQRLFAGLEPDHDHGFECYYLERLLKSASTTVEGHASPVTCLTVARQGRLMASGDESGRVLSWDLRGGRPVACQGQHDGPVERVAAAIGSKGQGGTIASLARRADGSLDVRFWDAATGAQTQSIREASLQAVNCEFSPDGARFWLHGYSAERPQGLCVGWRSGPDGWRPEARSGPGECSIQAYSADGRQHAVGKRDGTVVLESSDRNGSRDVQQKPGARVRCLAFSLDGGRLAAGRQDGSVIVWDTASGRVLAHQTDHGGPIVFLDFASATTLIGREQDGPPWIEQFDRPGSRRRLPGADARIDAISLSPDRALLAVVGPDQPVRIWDLSTLDLVGTYLTSAGVRQLTFAPDSQALILGCGDHQIRVWRFRQSRDLPHVLAGHAARVRTVAFSPDDRLLATGADDHLIKIWDRRTGRELLQLPQHDGAVTGLVFLPDGRLVSAGLDGRIILWTLSRADAREEGISAVVEVLQSGGEPIQTLSVPNTTNAAVLAVGGSHGTLEIWDLAAKRVKLQLMSHKGAVESVAYACNPAVLASASSDGTVCFWDGVSKTPRSPKRFDGAMRTVAFSADGSIMAASGDTREVPIWLTSSEQLQMTLSEHPLTVRSVVFSPVDQLIATGCDDGRVRLWDADTGMQLYSLLGHEDGINAMAFSNDGADLASCDRSGRVLLWRTDRPLKTISPSTTAP
jgi:WD40 repeat protein/serine/threonine protein kinase